MGQDQIAAELS